MLGISFDTVDENRRFAEEEGFPFPLLCDTTRATGVAYGAASSTEEKHPNRVTYVIGADGRIEQAIRTKDPAGQAGDLLATL